MKKKTWLIVIVCVALCIFSAMSLAGGTPVLTVEDVEGVVGNTVQVTVSISNPSGMAGGSFVLQYDPDIITPEGALVIGSYNDGYFGVNPTYNSGFTSSSIKITWANATGFNEDKILCKIPFKLNSVGTSSLIVDQLRLKDAIPADISSSSVNGSVNVISLKPTVSAAPGASFDGTSNDMGNQTLYKTKNNTFPVEATVQFVNGTTPVAVKAGFGQIDTETVDWDNWGTELDLTNGKYVGDITIAEDEQILSVVAVAEKDDLYYIAIFSGEILVEQDTESPTGTVSINGGAATAYSRQVQLEIISNATDLETYEISNDQENWTSYDAPVQNPVAWELADGDDGERTVYVRLTDDVGNYEVYFDTINYSTAIPEVSSSLKEGIYYSKPESKEVHLSNENQGAIYYTVDSSDPVVSASGQTSGSTTAYSDSAPITFSEDATEATIKAITVIEVDGTYFSGSMATFTYEFKKFGTINASLYPGTYSKPRDIALSIVGDNPETYIEYSLDEGNNWDTYESPIHVDEPVTISARIVSEKEPTEKSAPANFTYNFDQTYVNTLEAIKDAMDALERIAALEDDQISDLFDIFGRVFDLDLLPQDLFDKLEQKGLTKAEVQTVIDHIQDYLEQNASTFKTAVQDEDYGYLVSFALDIKAEIPQEIKDALARRGISQETLLLCALDLAKSGIDFFDEDQLRATVDNILSDRELEEDKAWLSSWGINYDNFALFLDNLSTADKEKLQNILENMSNSYVAPLTITLSGDTYVQTQKTTITTAGSGGTIKYLLIEGNDPGKLSAQNIWDNAESKVYQTGQEISLTKDSSGGTKHYHLYAVRKVDDKYSAVAEKHYIILSDTIPLALTAPVNNSVTKLGSVNVVGTTAPNANVEISIKTTSPGGTVSGPVTTTGKAQGDGTFSISVNLGYGANEITVTAKVTGGQQTAVCKVTSDTVIPTVTVNPMTSPTGNQVVNINGSYVEDYISKIEVIVNEVSSEATITPAAKTYSKNYALTEGENTIVVKITDQAGNVATSAPLTVYYDKTAPSITSLVLQPETVNGKVNVQFTAVVLEAGGLNSSQIKMFVNNIPYVIEGLNVTPSGSNWTITGKLNDVPQGRNEFKITVKDQVGLSGQRTEQLQLDTVPPTSWISVVKGANDKGVNGWYQVEPAVTLAASDGTIHYVVNNDPEKTGTSPITLDLNDGENTIEYWAIDAANNEETHKMAVIKIDTTDPAAPQSQVQAASGKNIETKGSNQYVTNSPTVTISGTVAEDVTKVTLTLQNSQGSDVPVTTVNVQSGGYSFNNVVLERETNIFKLKAVAESGRASAPLTLNIKKDIVGPSYTFNIDTAAKKLTVIASEELQNDTITLTSTFASFSGDIICVAGEKKKFEVTYADALPNTLSISARGQDLLGTPGQGSFTREVVEPTQPKQIDTGKAVVAFPAGTFAEERTVTVESIVIPTPAPPGFDDAGGTTSFDVGGSDEFNQSVTAAVYVNWAEGMNLNGLTLFYLNEAENAWELVDDFDIYYWQKVGDNWTLYPGGSVPQSGDNAKIELRFYPTHFSIYAGLVDNTPPDLSLDSPVDGLVTDTKTITVSGTTEKDATVKVNGTDVNVDGEGKFTKNLENLAEGDNIITVTASDAGGNTTTTEVNVFIDSIAPTIELDQEDMSIRSDNVTISGETNEPATIKIYGKDGLQITTMTDANNKFSGNIALAVGINQITVEAYDALNNKVSSVIEVVYDLVGPTLIPDGLPEYTNQATISVKGSSDASNLTISVNGDVPESVSLANGKFNETVTLIEGSNEIVITAFDALGNQSTTTLTITLDTQIPELAIDSVPATTKESSITITGTTEVGCSVWVNNVQQVAAVSADGKFSVVLSLVLDENTFSIYSKDNAGNKSETVTITVTRESSGGGGGGGGGGSSNTATISDSEVTKQLNAGNKVITFTAPKGTKYVEISGSTYNKIAEAGKDLIINVDKVSLRIPAGSFAVSGTSTKITLKVAEMTSSSAKGFTDKLDSAYHVLGQVFDITASTAPKKEITVTISYDDWDLAGVDEENLDVYWYNEAAGTWVSMDGTVHKGDNSIEFTTSHFSKYAVIESTESTESVVTFADIKNHWAKDDIELMVSEGVIKGISATEFAPNIPITRAQFAALLVRALGLEAEADYQLSFDDVAKSQWYYGEVAAAFKAGIIKGKSATSFAPNANITREEIAAMMARAMAVAGRGVEMTDDQVEEKLAKFTDASNIASWAKSEVAQAVELGIVNGRTENTFVPKANATRAESAVMIKRMYVQLD